MGDDAALAEAITGPGPLGRGAPSPNSRALAGRRRPYNLLRKSSTSAEKPAGSSSGHI
jgi:hypothetical protein